MWISRNLPRYLFYFRFGTMERKIRYIVKFAGYSIWLYLQASQYCRDCGFYAHFGCVKETKRECVAIKIKDQTRLYYAGNFEFYFYFHLNFWFLPKHAQNALLIFI